MEGLDCLTLAGAFPFGPTASGAVHLPRLGSNRFNELLISASGRGVCRFIPRAPLWRPT
jgi:hypothetical protein